MSHLFEPLQLGPLTLTNRIVIAPMCQYSAVDGTPGNWHLVHLGQMAQSGAGLLIIEATAVSPEGRITPFDLGLYSDANEAGLARVLQALRDIQPDVPMPIAVQIAHAGRKASSQAPWDGGAQIPPDQARGALGGAARTRRGRPHGPGCWRHGPHQTGICGHGFALCPPGH